MKKISIFFLVLYFLTPSLGLSQFRETSDIHFFKPPKKIKDIIPLFNQITSSLSYAFWTNQILNGSGTKSKYRPLKKELEAQQFLRMFSLFDLSLTRAVKTLENENERPQHFVYFFAPLEKSNIIHYKDFAHPIISKAQKVVSTLFSKSFHFPLKRLSEKDINIFNNKISFTPRFQEHLNQGLEKRLTNFWSQLEILNHKKRKTSLKDLHSLYQSLFVPFSLLCEINIDKVKGSHYKITLFLPSLFSIERGKEKDSFPFIVTPGLRQNLPFPINIPVAKFQKINYLKTGLSKKDSYHEAKKRLLKIEITKNFNNLNEIDLDLKFGSLWKKTAIPQITFKTKMINFFKRFKRRPEKVLKPLGTYPIDMTDMRSGLELEGFLHLPFIKKSSKTNRLLNTFKIQAFINRLHIKLVRPSTKSFEEAFSKNLTFKPIFDINQSSISFRLKKGANKKSHLFILEKGLGFHCKPNDGPELIGPAKFICIQDLSTMKNFKSEYSNNFAKRIKRTAVRALSVLNLKFTLKHLRNQDLVQEIKKKSPEIVQMVLSKLKKNYDDFHLTIGDPF